MELITQLGDRGRFVSFFFRFHLQNGIEEVLFLPSFFKFQIKYFSYQKYPRDVIMSNQVAYPSTWRRLLQAHEGNSRRSFVFCFLGLSIQEWQREIILVCDFFKTPNLVFSLPKVP